MDDRHRSQESLVTNATTHGARQCLCEHQAHFEPEPTDHPYAAESDDVDLADTPMGAWPMCLACRTDPGHCATTDDAHDPDRPATAHPEPPPAPTSLHRQD